MLLFGFRSAEIGVSKKGVSQEKSETAQYTYQPLSANTSSSFDGLRTKGSDLVLPTQDSSSFGGLPAKGSGSFDGPFRKPHAPAPAKSKTDWSE